MPTPLRVAVFGSTGSIGTQTLDIIRRANARAAIAGNDMPYRVVALGANCSATAVAEQVSEFRPSIVTMGAPSAAAELTHRLNLADRAEHSLQVFGGTDGIGESIAAADVVINAVVGFAGLPVTLQSLAAGKRLGLANKESLIAAGPVVAQARKAPGAEIVPVDSEHCALHQCLRANEAVSLPARVRQVSKLVITASGGPFRGLGQAQLAKVTVADALAHPTWSMGPKISIDSSTLMNKGLEVIEAHELFGVAYDQIEVLVHPQSIVHSMVEFGDGTTMAQLSMPDMRLCIGYALDYPERHPQMYGAVDWAKVGSLDFELPDRDAFRCLDLAYEAGRLSGTAPAALSAANEVSVSAFLKGTIGWSDIATVNEAVLAGHDNDDRPDLESVLAADGLARQRARCRVDGIGR